MRLIGKVLLTFLILLLFLNSPALGSQQSKRKKILVLFSFRPTLPVTSQWDKGIRSVLENQKAINPIINIEHVDLTHFGNEKHIELLCKLYRHKYSNPKPDLIIPVLNSSVDLMFKYGETLFPGVPIVFAGVESQFINSRKLRSNITGQLIDIDYEGTLELAVNLHKDTRNVVIVAGSGPVVQKWVANCQKAYKTYEKSYDFTFLTGLSMETLLERVEKLPPKTIVISLPVLVDGAGKEFVGNESLALISQASTAPIYTFWDASVGAGMVGGHVVSFEKEGNAVAELGLRVLKGEKPQNIPISQTNKFSYLFDWRQLKRWSIPEHSLPAGSMVMFKERSGWDQHKWKIIGVFLMVFLQTLAIFFLLYQRRARRQAEKEVMLAKQKYRTVADHTFDWEYWENPDGTLQYVSPSCKRISGHGNQAFMERPSLLQDLILPEDQKVWNTHTCGLQKGKKTEAIQFRIQRPDGKISWVEHVCQKVSDRLGNDQGVRSSNRDVTEREFYKTETRQLKAELAHMDRVVTISALTAALAHEINQPLTAMRSYAQAALRFMKMDPPEYPPVNKALQGIVADNKRASEVINRLRTLVKKGSTHWESIEMNSVIKEVLAFINSEIIIRNASITLDLRPDLPMIHGDSIQIQQVLINLVTNALDEMDNQPNGLPTITISTRPDNPKGVLVSVSDSGRGIPGDKKTLVFEPFHTTKTKGIGLGLAICKTIINSHGGEIWCDNNAKGGAIFSIILPADNRSN